MIFKYIAFIVLLTLSLTAMAQIPVPMVGNNCPPFTSLSGDYCIPDVKTDGSTESYIVKSGSNCPYGYYISGDYCRKGAGDKTDSIPRQPGKDCPLGWYDAGDYCTQ
jgi:hypothetical protein